MTDTADHDGPAMEPTVTFHSLMRRPDDGWTECPAHGRPAIPAGLYLARCPECEFTFSTVMDEPVMPRHWLSRDGKVRFGPPPP